MQWINPPCYGCIKALWDIDLVYATWCFVLSSRDQRSVPPSRHSEPYVCVCTPSNKQTLSLTQFAIMNTLDKGWLIKSGTLISPHTYRPIESRPNGLSRKTLYRLWVITSRIFASKVLLHRISRDVGKYLPEWYERDSLRQGLTAVLGNSFDVINFGILWAEKIQTRTAHVVNKLEPSA